MDGGILGAGPRISDSRLGCIPPQQVDEGMSRRRRFTAEFKARVALEALRGDKTLQAEEERKRIQ